MTCDCCASGRCCQGANCSGTIKAVCLASSGTFTSGETCSNQACVARAPYDSFCEVTNPCACAASGKDVVVMANPTCNCATLTSLGVPYGGCRAYLCQRCVSGTCFYICQSNQECCRGTCCMESQRCFGADCIDKCSSGNYCNTTASGGAYSYACCTPSQKCCGPSGCQSYSTQSGGFSGQSDKDPGATTGGWLDTALNLSASDSITITGSGTFPESDEQGLTLDGVTNTANNGNRFSTDFKFMALIGKVGASGTPFRVGTSYTGSPGTGRLYLRPNRMNYTSGASIGGPYSVSWSSVVDPCPGYTPSAVGEPVVYEAGEAPPPPAPGPGVELKYLLSLVGIVSSPTCSCNARAAQMDAWGGWESLRRLPEICNWLKEEADTREMWFFRPAGYALVLAAISLAALKRPFRGINK